SYFKRGEVFGELWASLGLKFKFTSERDGFPPMDIVILTIYRIRPRKSVIVYQENNSVFLCG
ncbi:hypothetical protein, partial [Dickeya solani]|uniref:hypothetical protein n=1 Tax=Dickeya solani TaxID=1089444 RepID=UPI001E2BB279